MNIYLDQDGDRTGPYTADEIRDRIASGAIHRHTQAWVEGAAEWVPAGELVDRYASPRYSGFWRRVAAYVIDALVLAIPLTILERTVSPGGEPVPVVWGGQGVVWWLYTALLNSSAARGTLGKQALGIQVTDLEGRRLSFAHATGRFIAELLTAFTAGLGYLLMLFNRKRQTLHDVIAGTVVTRR